MYHFTSLLNLRRIELLGLGFHTSDLCYPWLLFLGIVLYDNEVDTKENRILTKDKIEPQQIYEVIQIYY